jgi:hypothetical protein
VLAVPGAHQMASTAAQVMNALRAEEDLDERVAEELPQASIGYAKRKSVNASGNQHADNSGKEVLETESVSVVGADIKPRPRTKTRSLVVVERGSAMAAGTAVSRITSGLTTPTQSRVKTGKGRSSVLAWRPSGFRTRKVVALEERRASMR